MSPGTSVDDVPSDEPPSATKEVAKLRLKLNHLSLEQLEEQGLVTWEEEKNVVTKGPHFDQVEPIPD